VDKWIQSGYEVNKVDSNWIRSGSRQWIQWIQIGLEVDPGSGYNGFKIDQNRCEVDTVELK